MNNESSIYIGSSGILAIIVFILITYICYKKKRQTALEKVKSNSQVCSKETNPVHWKKDKKNNSENIYDEIDESLLCDIPMPTNEGNNLDINEDEENSNTIEEEVNEGYLNPYQPIISTEVDVHQYNTTKFEEDSQSTSDENPRGSGYLNPYQPLVASSANTKHEYTGIEPLNRTVGYRHEKGGHEDRE